ncbi:dienelactone hydrolase family protein [Nostoc sp. MS1]|uniref:dienelactone hydrolase family protein n=1 Tax=Nostoc sp. MS1 TaxID=2764711 RepID=UPI001CC64038|nr:dienelactone hydrolase family protein [Nostoc sp. MS1]
MISTPDGQMPAFLCTPTAAIQQAGVILLMEGFGLTKHIQDVAERIAKEGYLVLAPDLYYRELPNNKFGYDEVEQARAMMFRLDFEKSVDEDIRAAVAYVKSQLEPSSLVGVTGFCLGGGLAFLSACKLSDQIAAAAPFYGVILDQWLDAAVDIQVPMYLFFGDSDPFIPQQRVRQMQSRLEELGKDYQLKVYTHADHGFFCHERSSYNLEAAEDSWHKLTQFFDQHLH